MLEFLLFGAEIITQIVGSPLNESGKKVVGQSDDVAASLPRQMAASRCDRDEFRRLYIKLTRRPAKIPLILTQNAINARETQVEDSAFISYLQ
jgi:hypothetical protein